MVTVAVPKERAPGERRVALVPEVVARLVKGGARVRVEGGAGEGAYHPDAAYLEAGAEVVERDALLRGANLLLTVQMPQDLVEALEPGAVAVGFVQAHKNPDLVRALAARKATVLAMELIPRITRAQSMDALSSQATVAGYLAALHAARLSPRFFPMLTTAAGTIRPAKVMVMGVGVAGLVAIATARRLGAQVFAYDVRRAAVEQALSLGAKPIELPISAEGEGGYARELTEEEKRIQHEALREHVAGMDAIITTAQVPGRRAPILLTEDMVERLKPGTVVVDLAAESGGNCALTRPGEVVEVRGVRIFGPLNLPSELAVHASEMYAKNLLNLLDLFVAKGEFAPQWEDEILQGALLMREGEILHGPTKALVGGA
ncbi:NAD(P) transhydrogenase subunit alpha [Thermus thermamylovorans]|uniref:proton-translocating NAD(P)(+) transhydrogenase n=1 Tax=Thermus thermamylovorans TaxID=2509362 RepID=A0A4Q9AVV5_9DEIN|nr:NAD(P) transhydrogenase subunit alpha [Thermus thermamylovorans]TBH15236.1 NAD(P) transhydrogenase subunit alpha [Thermus thermamylovorans]